MSPSSTVRHRRSAPRDSRTDVFTAAAELFSARGFDGVGIDDIAHAARLNKAMIYYHFDSKRALYREVVHDMLRAVGTLATEAASRLDAADRRLESFIAAFIQLADQRPWFPPLMLREIAEGAPRLEPDTLALMKTVFMAFSRILADGQASGLFRPINPVLAYMSILGPILLNAARERAAARPGRLDLPMFADVSHADLTTHMQLAAMRLLSPQETRP
ncbi:MAG: TetR/AcrR family transcriptional regulator [Acidobacteria bacterium]|nr:TetR/AcrR family transcriptional regulator [Acidobacteriota bacterium]